MAKQIAQLAHARLWFSWKVLFLSLLVNQLHHGFDVFSMPATKCTGPTKPWSNLGLLFCPTKSKVLVVCQFFLELRQIFCR